MFTGIITDLGRVRRLRRGAGPEGGLELTIATAYKTDEVALGASIACSGPCLTVVAVEPGAFAVQASAETLACSTLADWTEGTLVNLERALRLGDELGGHLVSGHVDGVGKVTHLGRAGADCLLRVRAPRGLARYIARKGSIAVHGVSLTVNAVRGAEFEVNLIPHTLAVTTLKRLRAGDRVNLEVDPLARYAERLLRRK